MKIYLVIQESCFDGEILFNVVPCKDEETAKKVMQKEISILLSEGHYEDYFVRPRDFILEQTDTSWFIKDTCDDFYEDIKIEEKEII